MAVRTAAILAVCAIACSEPRSPAPTSESPVASPVTPLAVSLGGRVVSDPKIVYFTFDGDPLRDEIVRFHRALEASSYWADAGREYGVGAIGSTREVRAGAPPIEIDRADIEAWLYERIAAQDILLDPDTLYAVYYPVETTVTYGGRRSCGFNGFHGEMTVGGVAVGFAVLPRCPAIAPFGSELDRLTMTASHEYFEWGADPFPSSSRAYHAMSADGAAWALAYAAELGDLCFGEDMRVVPSDLGFAVQRLWSNEAARRGRDPCQPGPSAYAFAQPELPDRFALPPALSSEVERAPDGVPGIVVPPGETRVVRVRVVGDPTDPVTLAVGEGGRMLAGQGLSLTLRETASPTELTITAPAGFAAPTVVTLYLHHASEVPSARTPFLVSPTR